MSRLIDRMIEVIERDHGGCDQNTCDISVAIRNGYPLVAIESWSGCGAGDSEFDRLYSWYRRINPKAYDDWREECAVFCGMEHVRCPNCNAVLWLPDECDYHCDNCGTDIPQSA